ncbi:MAG: hypothetical protein WA397_13095 [Roseiarcus sp.]
MPLYLEALPHEKCDAELLRGDTFFPLKRLDPGAIVEQPLPNDMRDIPADIARRATFAVPIASEDKIVDRRVTPGAGATIAAVAEASAAVAAVQAALPDPKTMAAIDQAVAAVERFGAPAFVSTYPLSPAEAAQRLRDAPPRLTPADQAAFAAAAHSFQKGP